MIQQATHIPQIRRANKAEVAEFFGVTLPTIEAWLRRGCPIIQKGARGVPWVIDLFEVATWRLVGEAGPTEDFDPDKLTPKERLDWYRAESEKRKLQEKDRELIPALEHERAVADLVELAVTTVDTLPDILERDAGISGATVVRAQAVIDKLRMQLYSKMTKKDGAKPNV